MDENNVISNYVESSKNVAIYIAIAVVLTIIFIISPLDQFRIGYIAKVLIIGILAYAVYKNLKITLEFSKNSNINLFDSSWSNYKTNLSYSYLFTFFILLLLFSVVKTLFQ